MRVLILGATGTMGRPVAQGLVAAGHAVRALARNVERARRMLGPEVEVVEGDSTDRSRIATALGGCDAVHVSLPTESELVAVNHIVELARDGSAQKLARISYVSGTSVREENRWFPLVDVKMRAEEVLRRSGVAHTVFCPTWVMEVLANFVRPDRAVVIEGKNPPEFHFLAAADFGRMVATSHQDDRSIGKRLFIHGPGSITLPEAIRRFHEARFPRVKLLRLRPWQARLVAKLTRNPSLGAVARLIAHFDTTEEHGTRRRRMTSLEGPKPPWTSGLGARFMPVREVDHGSRSGGACSRSVGDGGDGSGEPPLLQSRIPLEDRRGDDRQDGHRMDTWAATLSAPQ